MECRDRRESRLLETITRDVKWLKKRWVKELIKNPVEHQARTLATLYELEREAAEKYTATESSSGNITTLGLA